MSLKGNFFFYGAQLLSKRINEKLVVIESDDWGSERVPSKEVRDKLRGFTNNNNNPHAIYDCLEQEEDVLALLETLKKLDAKHHKKVKLTLNFITCNPDYDKIKTHQFQTYYPEDFRNTYLKRDGHDKTWSALKSGIIESFFVPQFHGREHIWVDKWMNRLKEPNSPFMKAFEMGSFGPDIEIGDDKLNILEAWNIQKEVDEITLKASIDEGLKFFKDQFGYHPLTVVAPRHVWDQTAERILKNNGIKVIQSANYRLKTIWQGNGKQYLYTGQKSEAGIRYTCRNAYFEPAYGKTDWVGQVLKKAHLAFTIGIPLIISSHRINFSGGIETQNRQNTLHQFTNLIDKLIAAYPDVDFLSTDDLVNNYIKAT